MASRAFNFQNAEGQSLSGLLETPNDGQITNTAVFAHCFTCGKSSSAASRISRALTRHGTAVLRFDFTGLGGSDGDFANTNFSSNISDLEAAVSALGEQLQQPSMLIGHSLGGAAVLVAAGGLPQIKAVATIGAPATAKHVEHLIAGVTDTVAREGEATVAIGLSHFTIKQQFIDDLATYASAGHIANLSSALMVFHSPEDEIVPIDEASRIYRAAAHPKSFVSLAGADHLLRDKSDAAYVADTLSAWSRRYLPEFAGVAATAATTKATTQVDAGVSVSMEDGVGAAIPELAAGEVLVDEANKKFKRIMYAGRHQLLADEPERVGGEDLGPTPYDLLLMSLGACTSMTLRMYANRKNLNLDGVRMRLQHERVHAQDCESCGDHPADAKLDRIVRTIELDGDLTAEQRLRLLEIADRCPVHRTLENHPMIQSTLLES